MEKVLLNYLGEKLIDDLRSGAQLPSELLGLANQVEIVDVLRKYVGIEDFRWIRSMCDSKEDGAQQLGLSLVRNIQNEKVVRSYLEEMWKNKDNRKLSFNTEIVLQSQLLWYSDLDLGFHKSIWDSLVKHWDEWISEVKSWTGGAENVLAYIESRVKDPRFPKSKHWYYICCAPASNDPIKVRELIEGYIRDPDPFMRGVANELMGRLSSSGLNE